MKTRAWGGSTCTSLGGHTFVQTYGYTPGGLVTQKALNTLTATYTYNNEGRVVTMKPPSGGSTDPALTYTYSFDSLGHPVSMVDNQTTPVTWVQSVTFNAADQMTQIALVKESNQGFFTIGNENRQYNSLSQLTQISTANGGNYQYMYSPTQNNGRITQLYNTANTYTNYGYDTLNRLSAASGLAGGVAWGDGYTYDGFGNLTDKTVTAGTAPALHVLVNAANNRITTSGYGYDANGNLTGGIYGPFTATYDVENRLATITPTGAGTESYSYGPDNVRVYKMKASGAEELHFYGVYGERLGTFNYAPAYLGETIERGVYFGGRALWRVLKSHGNPINWTLGSVRSWDRLGSTTSALYPYGEEIVPAGQHDNEEFATYYRDSSATALDYAQNRYYSSNLGRFLSADPSRSNGLTDPSQWNKYAYVGGDPINRKDPSGLTSCDANGDNCYDSVDVTADVNHSDVAYSYASTVSPQSFYTPFGRDRAYLIHAGGILMARGSISAKCQGGMKALKVDFFALANAASMVDIQNGTNDSNSIASAFGSAQLGTAAQAQYDKQFASYLQAHGEKHLTIADYFAATGNTAAWTPTGGNAVFISPALLNTRSLNLDQGLMLHEMLHEVYGLDDTDIMNTLAGYDPRAGINPNGVSQQITNWLAKNCVAGKGNK